MRLVAVLEAGRRDFLEATCNITQDHASAKPTSGCWSVLECIEHVIAVEERSLSSILKGATIKPQRDSEKEMRLFSMVRSRLTKVEAPDAFRPRGRFATLAEALAAFNAVRDRSIQLAGKHGDDLYAMGMKHPFFGKLNGVELIGVIDGHARRHADQIREICEAAAAAARTQRKTSGKVHKRLGVRRDPPDLPNHLECAGEPEGIFDSRDAVAIEDVRVPDVQRENLRLGDFRVEGSVLERVQLGGGEWGSAVWKDVRLVGCDLANVRAHRVSLLRVEFVDCRITGFSATALECRDVLIQNGDVRYTQFQGARFQNCEFNECNWQDADLQKADLTGSIFRSCDLTRADLRGAILHNADFRTSEVEGMLVEMNDLRGAIVNPAQAMIFARLLGLHIL